MILSLVELRQRIAELERKLVCVGIGSLELLEEKVSRDEARIRGLEVLLSAVEGRLEELELANTVIDVGLLEVEPSAVEARLESESGVEVKALEVRKVKALEEIGDKLNYISIHGLPT